MKILIEESVLRQALEALAHCAGMRHSIVTTKLCDNAGVDLRTALDAAEKVEEQLSTVTAERDELVAALDKISRVNAMDYEYQRWAKDALAKLGADKTETT